MTGTDQNLVDTIRLLLKGKLGGEPDVYLTHDGHIRVETRVGVRIPLDDLRNKSGEEAIGLVASRLARKLA